MGRVGSKEKIRRFLRSRVGKVVTAAQIQAAAGPGVTEWARRLRELRGDDEWKISSHNDRGDLKPGEYVLEEAPPEAPPDKPVFSRGISSRLRAQVLERNGYTCQMCGIGAGDIHEQTGRKARLHIGHVVDKSHGGKEEMSNLKALCSQCNQGAKNLVQEPPSWTWLLGQVRRAPVKHQRKALEWLKSKLDS